MAVAVGAAQENIVQTLDTNGTNNTSTEEYEDDDPVVCYFNLDNTAYLIDQLLSESSQLVPSSRFCLSCPLKSSGHPASYSLTRWTPCDNHNESLDSSTNLGDADHPSSGGVLQDSKKRVRHRFPVVAPPAPSTNLTTFGPHGHHKTSNKKKNEYVFRHYGRIESYMEQYRCDNTFGGTGRRLRQAEIAQSLMGMVKSGQIRFPIIRYDICILFLYFGYKENRKKSVIYWIYINSI